MESAANVTPIRRLASVLKVVPHPQVFTDPMVERLRVVNRQVRWLRMHNHAIKSIDMLAFRPTLLVDASAASLLISAGRGKSSLHRIGEARLHWVVIDGCKLQWREKEAV